MGKNFFNGTDADLYIGGGSFSDAITLSPTAYGLTAGQASAYSVAYAAYGGAYEAAVDPDTRTKAKVSTKNDKRKALRAMSSDLALIINGTPTVTDAQKISLGLNVRKSPSPTPTPSTRPSVDVLSVSGRTVTTSIHDGGITPKRRKAPGSIAAYVYTFVGETYPSDPTAWQFQGSATKSPYPIIFPDSVAGGAQVWIAAAWINRRGEAGPVSVPVSTNVQGGGVSTPSMKIAA